MTSRFVVRVCTFALVQSFLFAASVFADTSVSGRISADTTWTLANSPYVVTSTVQVYGTTATPVTLTIQPGVVVKFNSGMGLQIGSGTNQGALVAQGTSVNRITFTRSGTSGTWSGITFNSSTVSSTTTLSYADIQYSTGVTMTSASPTISNSTITNMSGYISCSSSNADFENVTVASTNSYAFSLSSSNPVLNNVAATANGYIGMYLISSNPTITGGSLTNSSAAGYGIYGSGSPVISNYSISINNAANYYGLYFTNTNSALSVSNSTIANGIYISALNISPTITGNTFTNADNSPIHAGANIIGQIMNSNTVSGMSSAGRIEVAGEQVSQDAHWAAWPAPYVVVSGTVLVYKNTSSAATLTIDPGVTIKFASTSGIQIGYNGNQGALVAQGTSGSHITFTRSGTSGTWGTITFNNGTVNSTTTLSYADIQYGTGVYLSSASFAISNSTITNAAGYGLYLSSSNPALNAVTISNNGPSGIYLYSSNPTITGGSLTNSSATGHGIYGSGSPVISNYTISIVNAANYYGVSLSSATSALSITNSTVSNGLYLGSTGIAPTVTGNTFTNADTSPIHAGANIIGGIMNNNTVTGMTSAGRIEVIGETISQNSEWKPWAAPYVVTTGMVYVYKDTNQPSTLTIDPGVVVRFGLGAGLQIGNTTYKGALVARGTAGNGILFTSSQANPAPGNWSGITLSGAASSASDLEYVTIEYAGSGASYANADHTLSSSAPIVRNSIVRNSAGSGIYLSSATGAPAISGLTASNNKWGVYSYGSNPVISGSSITGNTTAGVTNSTPSTAIDARNNWWGHYKGPRNASNPNGLGDVVSDGVLFNPWLGQAPGSTFVINNAKASPLSLNPEGDYVVFSGAITASANWTIAITDSNNASVRNFSGSGTTISQIWYGENDQKIKVPDGGYYYTIQAVNPSTNEVATAAGGPIMVSRQLPIAILTLPADNQMFAGGSTINVTGTANDAVDFKNYSLDYGVGENPASWINLKPATTTPVVSGAIYSWNTSGLTGGVCTLRLTVTDTANNVATETARVRLLLTQNAAASEAYISPNGDGVKDASAISATFTYSSNWTITIKNASSTTVRTYTGAGTSVNQAWDGKDGSGQVVPDGPYTYQIDAVSAETNVTAAAVTGTINVDTTVPVAQISAPAANAVLWNTIQISGTATDANFDTYKVEYGPASGSGPWTNINSGTAPVSSGTLATWITNDGTNSVLLANGNYLLRLTATDKAGNSAATTVPVSTDNLLLSGVSASSHTLDTSAGQTTNISYTINKPATVTLKIVPEKQGPAGTPVYQTSQTMTAAGPSSFTWDGKNNAGTVVPDEAYLYVLEASDGTKSDTYSPDQPAGTGTVTCSQSASFDPVKNIPLTVTYTPAQPSRVDVTIAWWTHTFKIVDAFPAMPGTYTAEWNGWNPGSGLFYFGSTSSCAVSSLLRENVIVTTGDTPQITALRADPYVLSPAFGQFTRITYALSKDSLVTISLVPPTGTPVTVASNQLQSAGPHEVDWNGIDPSNPTGKAALITVEGEYQVSVRATNPATGSSSIKQGNVKIGY